MIQKKMSFRLKEVTVVGRAADQVSDQDTDQDTDQVEKRITDHHGTPAERLLSVLGKDTLSAAELIKRLGLSHRPTFRKNYLNPALEQKLIERTIPDKPNNKNQKYQEAVRQRASALLLFLFPADHQKSCAYVKNFLSSDPLSGKSRNPRSSNSYLSPSYRLLCHRFYRSEPHGLSVLRRRSLLPLPHRN